MTGFGIRLSREAEQRGEDVKFHIIEPPRVPLVPNKPNRPLMSSVVTAFGIGAGLGFAWLLSQARPAFYSRRSLKQSTTIPVLGSISLVRGSRDRIKRRLGFMVYGVSWLGLFAVFGGLLTLQIMRVDLAARLSVLRNLLT